VRVIGADGEQVGVIATQQAMRLADESGLDLVEISPRANPPVCRIMDYGKFKYEAAKKEKASKKHQSTITVKEIKLRPKTDQHDFEFKAKHIERFLKEGNKCKLVVQFRGREIVHPETGQAMLRAVIEYLGDLAQIESAPSMEGRRMVMIIGPRSGVVRPARPAPSRPDIRERPPRDADASPGAGAEKRAAAAPGTPERAG